jgi:mannose-6-phosphate isomerase-like protein (cupin superfamily)
MMTDHLLERLRDGSALSESASAGIEAARPWGGYVVMPPGGRLPKLLSLTGESSLHFHQHKDEIYVIAVGEGAVYRGALEASVEATIAGLHRTDVRPGDVLQIPRGTVHAVVSRGLVMMDAAYGDDPREEDVIRVYDSNGRGQPVPGVAPLRPELLGHSLEVLVSLLQNG